MVTTDDVAHNLIAWLEKNLKIRIVVTYDEDLIISHVKKNLVPQADQDKTVASSSP